MFPMHTKIDVQEKNVSMNQQTSRRVQEAKAMEVVAGRGRWNDMWMEIEYVHVWHNMI